MVSPECQPAWICSWQIAIFITGGISDGISVQCPAMPSLRHCQSEGWIIGIRRKGPQLQLRHGRHGRGRRDPGENAKGW